MVSLAAVQTLLLEYSIHFDFTNIINGGDTLQLLSPQLFIQRSLFLWLEYGTGISLPTPGYWIFYAVPLYFFNMLSGSINVATFTLFASLFSLSSISMFLLGYKVTGNTGSAFFVSIFYSLNLYTAIVFHTPVAHIIYFFSITPLLVLIFMKMEGVEDNRRKMLYLACYMLFFLPLVRTLNIFVTYLAMIPLTTFILKFGIRIPVKRLIKYFILSSLMILIIAFPFLIPQVFHSSTLMTPVNLEFSRSAAAVALQQRIGDSIRFVGTYALTCPHDEAVGGILSYSFIEQYIENPFLFIISYYPFVMVSFLLLYCYPRLQRSEKRKIKGLLLLAFLSLLAATPNLTPLGTMLYESKIYIFRSAWKYFSVLYMLSLSLILSVLLKRLTFHFQNKKFLYLLLVLFLIHSVYILPAIVFYGRTINQSWVVKVPVEYYVAAEFLNIQEEEFRVLPSPVTKHFAGYVPYEWGYVGPDILYTLTDKPLLDKMANPIAPMEYLTLTERLEGATPEELIQLCKVLNVKYILLRKDVDLSHPYIKLNNPPEYYESALEKLDVIKNKYVFGSLVFYELKEYTPRIFAVSAGLGRNLSEMFFYATHQPENVAYLDFSEDSAPINLTVDGCGDVEGFSLNISFAFKPKNVTSSDWQEINYAPIQTNLFKVSFSPKGVMYVFAYSKEGELWALTRSFKFETGTNHTLNLEFRGGEIRVTFDYAEIGEGHVNPPSLPVKVIVGSNMGGTEKYVGEIYRLDLSVNGEKAIETGKLLQEHPEYAKTKTIYKLHLTPERVEWLKLSPTKYVARVSNPTGNGAFLVLLNTYDPNWKAYYVHGGLLEEIPEEKHIHAFDYANAWYIDRKGEHIMVIEYAPQKIYSTGMKTTSLILLILLAAAVLPRRIRTRIKHYFYVIF